MTNSLTYPAAPIETKSPLDRGLLRTTLSYMKWGYGALLFSLLAYGVYTLARSLRLAVAGVTLQGFLLGILTALAVQAVIFAGFMFVAKRSGRAVLHAPGDIASPRKP
jgi:hypothetical protein